jgi:membrane protein DedA with SNARE-associated domain
MEDLIAKATAFLATHGSWAGPLVGLLAFGESLAIVGLLIPGTAILLGVGGLVGAGLLDPAWVIAWTFVGAVTGNWASYVIGRRIGPRAYRSWPLNRNRRGVARARLFFRRFGFAAVLLSRFLGPLRAIVPLVAGVMEMGSHRFQVANLISAIIWVPAVLAPGYFAADSLGSDAEIGEFHLFAFVAGIGILTAVGGWAAARVLKGTSRSRSKRRR